MKKANKIMINLEVTNEECDDCQRAKDNIANMFPFIKRATRLLTNDDMKIYYAVIKDVNKLTSLYNEIFSEGYEPCNCPDIHAKMLEHFEMLRQYQLK